MIWSWKFCMQNLAPFEAHLFTPWGTLFHKRLQTISKDFPPELVLDWIDGHQVWSLPSFEVSCQLLMNDLNQISSAFLLMTSSMALASTIRWVRSSYSRMTTCILLDLSHWKFWYIKDFCNLNRTVLAPTWRIWNLFKIFAQNPPLLPLFSRGAGRVSTNLLDALAQS